MIKLSTKYLFVLLNFVSCAVLANLKNDSELTECYMGMGFGILVH